MSTPYTNSPAYPLSETFNEHYWSGGAPEKTHTYLLANNLPTRFAGTDTFTVAELGFGTALNFLLTAQLWQQTATVNAHLTFISYELHPLTADHLIPIHAAFPHSLHTLSQTFLNLYNPQPGWNTLHLTPAITLHLYGGDAATGIATHPKPADCWFLDGFSPKNNPALWTPELFTTLARNSKSGATASTYSVASQVQKALTAAGFTLAQISGYPPKGKMLTAYLK